MNSTKRVYHAQAVIVLECFLALVMCCLSILPVSASDKRLKIGIIGDQTGTPDIEAAYATFDKGADILSTKGVRSVIHIGDLLESRLPETAYRSLYKKAARILDKIGVPWYLTVGNHDISRSRPPLPSDAPSRTALFQALYGTRAPEVKNHLYYSIDIDAYHFVFLNSQDEFHADSRWGNIFLARLSEAQMQWLEKDLEDHRTMEGIIVFSHIPLWYNGSGWRRVHELLRRYPVSAVIAGHFHYDQDDGEIDGIRYVVVGATGGHLKQAHPDAGGIQHVTVMTLIDGRPEFELIAVETQQAMDLTPRVDMDRIQALDQMLNGLWSFDKKNRLVMKNRQLLASCETGEPAAIRLQCVGNPIDVPVRLNITVDAEAIQMVSPGFLQAAYLQPVSDTECLLAPGARVATANLSSVKLRDNLEPLWSAHLALNEGAFPHPPKIVKVNARLSFAGEQGELYVERQATVVTRACENREN